MLFATFYFFKVPGLGG